MRASPTPWPAGLALVASIIGLFLAGSSTFDYAQHLDRQVHGIHCSYVPGLGAAESADNACRAAMFSPYSAILRDRYWGGVPISLFAMGAFAFFAAFALYLLLARSSAPRRMALFFLLAGLTPLAASAVMAYLSVTRVGEFCKTCVGIYGASALLAIAAIVTWVRDRRERSEAAIRRSEPDVTGSGVTATIVDDVLGGRVPRPEGGPLVVPAMLFSLGVFAAVPPLLYANAVPSYATSIGNCGKLAVATEPSGALIHVSPVGAVQPATMFVDPLCPTCKGFHQRLGIEGVMDKLDLQIVLFPLDDACNWMLDRAVHPGSCIVSKAILCSDDRAVGVLEWAYENQDAILEAAKNGGGDAAVRALIRARFSDLDACIDKKETALRLDKMLRYIVDNQLAVSTPQLFLGDVRLCDEDTDIGLAYTLRKLSPALGGP